MNKGNKGFMSTDRKGFHMIFSNGLTASVQWGFGNYCDNYHNADMCMCNCARFLEFTLFCVAV